jgi:hypothetical protein
VSEIAYLYPERRGEPVKVTLGPGAAADLDRAELFLLSLDAEMLTADGPRTAYLLGLAEGHLANLVDAVRSVAR